MLIRAYIVVTAPRLVTKASFKDLPVLMAAFKYTTAKIADKWPWNRETHKQTVNVG